MKNDLIIAGLVLAALTTPARSQSLPIADVSHAESATARLFNGFFAAQSAKKVGATMAYFSPKMLTYGDATLGTQHPGYDSLQKVFAEYMPKWGAGRCYATRIIGGPNSALVAFTTTREVWGAELRILGAVDLRGGKIVRWVDYFDSTAFPAREFAKMRTPQAKFPATFQESAVASNASPKLRALAARFQKALAAGEAATLTQMMSDDAIYEDMALRQQIVGKSSIASYLSRVAGSAPFGAGAQLRHVVGGDLGGGFEWMGGQNRKLVIGVTALELDAMGRVSRITTSYDSRQLGPEKARKLALLALRP